MLWSSPNREPDYDYDEDKYDDDDYDDTQIFEEWRLDFENSFAESQKKQDELWNESQRKFKQQLQHRHEELSRKLNKGFIRVQEHMDTTISNVEDRLNDRI